MARPARRSLLRRLVPLGALALAVAPLGAQEAPGTGLTVAAADSAPADAAVTATTVSGRVMTHLGEPMSRVTVRIVGNETAFTITDDDGRFAFRELPTGLHVLTLLVPRRRPIFADLTFNGPIDRVTVKINPDITILPEIVAEGAKRERVPFRNAAKFRPFEERKARGRGFFMTRDQIEQQQVGDATELFRSVPGVRVMRARLQRQTIEMGRCRDVVVFVDGMYGGRDLPTVLSTFHPQDIEAIEVHIGTVPPEYDSGGNCAAVGIWTR